MKPSIKITLACLMFCMTALSAQEFGLSDAKISFEFVSKKTKGSIEGFDSNSVLDFSNPSNSIVKGYADVATLDTNNGLRNWSLKSRKYFNENAHPRIYFTSKTIKVNENSWQVMGVVTIKGVEKPMDINFIKEGNTLIGTAQLYSSDFGINIKKNREDNLVKLRMVYTLNQKSD